MDSSFHVVLSPLFSLPRKNRLRHLVLASGGSAEGGPQGTHELLVQFECCPMKGGNVLNTPEVSYDDNGKIQAFTFHVSRVENGDVP